MSNAPIQLHRHHRLIHDSQRLMEKAEALLAHSRAFVTYGRARAEARLRASLTDEEALHFSAQRDETHPVQPVQCRCDPARYAAHMAHGLGSFMKITSTTNLEFPRLKFAIRQGEVKDLPDDPEAAAFILASVSIQEVPEPESQTTRKTT